MDPSKKNSRMEYHTEEEPKYSQGGNYYPADGFPVSSGYLSNEAMTGGTEIGFQQGTGAASQTGQVGVSPINCSYRYADLVD
jgi:hypothetical protein